MGGISPDHPWYNAGDQPALDDSLEHLRLIDPERRKRAFIVRNYGNEKEFISFVRAAGLRFPEDYELITPPMFSPFTHAPFEIWRPKLLTRPGIDPGNGT
jgi:hypothetical protein